MNLKTMQQMAKEATDEIYVRDPDLFDKYGLPGKRKCYEDNMHHLKQLSAAADLQDPKIFADYALWLNGILQKHGMDTAHLRSNFEILKSLMTTTETNTASMAACLDAGMHALDSVR